MTIMPHARPLLFRVLSLQTKAAKIINHQILKLHYSCVFVLSGRGGGLWRSWGDRGQRICVRTNGALPSRSRNKDAFKFPRKSISMGL